jgi:acyl-CoA thioester hydrolase
MFVHQIRVRYSECDQQGVVFNAHYLFYYDDAITELWREHICPYQEMTAKGDDVMVAEARLRYRKPARFDDLVDIEVNIQHLGNTSMIVRPVFRVDGEVIADGEVRHVFIDAATHQKKSIPDYVRAGLPQ